MTPTKKLLWVGGICSALIAIGGFVTWANTIVETHRPYAVRVTERVVADMQLAQFSNDLRDIDARIVRLENKKRTAPRMWTQQDEAELRYWYQQRQIFIQRMEAIRQQQRPQYYGTW